MTVVERNELFEQHMYLIRYVIRKNHSLIYALRLNLEDVSQDLSVCMIKAIETFDSSRGMKLSTYIVYKLQFGILALRKDINRSCRVANLNTRSIDNAYSDEDEQTLDIPIEVDYDSNLFLQEIYKLLTENEKEVVNLRMDGVSLQDKRQKRLFDRVKKKTARFYMSLTKLEGFYEKQAY